MFLLIIRKLNAVSDSSDMICPAVRGNNPSCREWISSCTGGQIMLYITNQQCS